MGLADAELEPLLRLALTAGVGPQRLTLLIDRYGSAEQVLATPARELALLPGVGPRVAEAVARQGGREGRAAARQALTALRRAGAIAITRHDAAYPDVFRFVHEPPFLLFAAGRFESLESPAVAIVGSRTPTRYGREAATSFARDLAAHGYAIVSGMARGVDSAAHLGAVEVGGVTIGVLGHGIDLVYPPENRSLFARVREGGLLLSEFVPGETPRAGNFPRRNRLIAALSDGVVVVEMKLASGAQHTVNFALELGREVMAVPGAIDSPQSEGSNQLIRDGARAVTRAAEVIEELSGISPGPDTPTGLTRRRDPPALLLLDERERVIVEALDAEPRHVDALAEETGIGGGQLLATLLDLELRGVAESLPGKRFRRI